MAIKILACDCPACSAPPERGPIPPPIDAETLRWRQAARHALALSLLGDDLRSIVRQVEQAGHDTALAWQVAVFAVSAVSENPRHIDPATERWRVELALRAMDEGRWLVAAQNLYRVSERLASWALHGRREIEVGRAVKP